MIGIVAGLVFVSVNNLLPLTFPTDTGPQLRLEGFATSVPTLAIPVPDSATVSGLTLVELEIASAAERAPVFAVLNRIESVHVAATGRFNPHDDPEIANSLACAPVIETLLRATGPAVPLFRVTDSDLPSEPA